LADTYNIKRIALRVWSERLSLKIYLWVKSHELRADCTVEKFCDLMPCGRSKGS
jgi:hypothetical protein